MSALTASINATTTAAVLAMERIRDTVVAAVGGTWDLDAEPPLISPLSAMRSWSAVSLRGAPLNVRCRWIATIYVSLEENPPRVCLEGSVNRWGGGLTRIASVGEHFVNPDWGPEAAEDVARYLGQALVGSLAEWMEHS